MLGGKPIVDVDHNAAMLLNEEPTVEFLVLQPTETKPPSMVDHEQGTATARRRLWGVDSDRDGVPVTCWNRAVLFFDRFGVWRLRRGELSLSL